MKIIDLSQPIYNKAKDGWNVNYISFPSHIATHVNVPGHAVESGKTLDDYPVDAFIGKSVVFQNLESIKKGIGLFFESASIKDEVVQKIIEVRPKFVGVQGYFESEKELEIEKLLLRNSLCFMVCH